MSKKSQSVDQKSFVLSSSTTEVLSATRFTLGLWTILIAFAASFVLVLDHFGTVSPPGCGLGGACEKAANSFWGGVRLGDIRWPTSFIGNAYFLAAMIGWVLAWRGGVTGAFKNLVRLGAAVSVFFLVIIFREKHFCPYCIASHAGNLLFWLTVETAAKTSRRNPAAVVAALAMLLLSTAVLAGIEIPRQRETARQDALQREQSIKQVIASAHQQPPATSTAPTAATKSAAASASEPQSPPFTGRYRIGPEDAPIRLVIISDFQCPDCQQVEAQVRAVMQGRDDISLSAKHHPMCPDCNRFMLGQRMHDNACWAARASEAAGILGGNDGFWRMYYWLFDRKGFFTKEEIDAALPELGFDVEQFTRTMMSDQTLDLVKGDIEEAHSLGLHFTPMIFINGHEVRGFIRQPNAIKQAVDQIAATRPPRATAAQDHADNALRKCVGDWKVQFQRPMPKTSHTWSLGPADAAITVDVWSDQAFKVLGELEQIVRGEMKAGKSIRYVFRQYPANSECNPHVKSGSPKGCWAAAASEAAGRLGGNEAFWKVHDWLGANLTKYTDQELAAAAPSFGLDGAALLAAMGSPEVQAAIQEDIRLGEPYIMQGLPTVYVNGRWVPRWKLDDEPVLKAILDEAAKR